MLSAGEHCSPGSEMGQALARFWSGRLSEGSRKSSSRHRPFAGRLAEERKAAAAPAACFSTCFFEAQCLLPFRRTGFCVRRCCTADSRPVPPGEIILTIMLFELGSVCRNASIFISNNCFFVFPTEQFGSSTPRSMMRCQVRLCEGDRLSGTWGPLGVKLHSMLDSNNPILSLRS